jgi:8-oxo-dGTP pyrophosphatase MutT (NUDIX family)
MHLTNTYKGHSGVEYIFEYSDADTFHHLDLTKCTQTYAVCFCGEKIVIGFGGQKNAWGLIGGTIEQGETLEQTLRREIKEEANMKVLKYRPIGYQKVTDTRDGNFFYQLRYVCIVQPYGPFVADPDNGITEIKLIDPKEYKQYFDWGDIGERIIVRATTLLPLLK